MTSKKITRLKRKQFVIPPTNTPDTKLACIRVPNDYQHVANFWGQLEQLARWYNYEHTGDDSGALAANRWKTALEEAYVNWDNQTCADEDFPCPPVPDCLECRDVLNSDPRIRWSPSSPFDNPDYVPIGYSDPPFGIGDGGLLGIPEGVVYVDQNAILPPLSWNPVENWKNTLGLIESGFPRFSFDVSGSGEIELHLRAVPQGGIGIIFIHSEDLFGVPYPDDLTFLNLGSVDILSLTESTELLDLIETILGLQLGGGIYPKTIVEIPIDSDKLYTVTVTFVPQFGTDSIFGFGGAFDKLNICGDIQLGDIAHMEVQLKPADPCILQWRPNPDAEWIDLGNVCGADGANAPLPVMTFDGTVLNIDVDNDGIVDASQDLVGADGDCPDCPDFGNESYPVPSNLEWYCHSAAALASQMRILANAWVPAGGSPYSFTVSFNDWIDYGNLPPDLSVKIAKVTQNTLSEEQKDAFIFMHNLVYDTEALLRCKIYEHLITYPSLTTPFPVLSPTDQTSQQISMTTEWLAENYAQAAIHASNVSFSMLAEWMNEYINDPTPPTAQIRLKQIAGYGSAVPLPDCSGCLTIEPFDLLFDFAVSQSGWSVYQSFFGDYIPSVGYRSEADGTPLKEWLYIRWTNNSGKRMVIDTIDLSFTLTEDYVGCDNVPADVANMWIRSYLPGDTFKEFIATEEAWLPKPPIGALALRQASVGGKSVEAGEIIQINSVLGWDDAGNNTCGKIEIYSVRLQGNYVY